MDYEKKCMVCGKNGTSQNTAYCRKHLKEIETFLELEGLYPQIPRGHINLRCFICGDMFYGFNSASKTSCCTKCSKIIKDDTISKNNYILSSSSKKSHRDIATNILKRKIKANEIVHHIDLDKSNNSLSNLLVFSRKQHVRLHSFLYQQRVLFEKNSMIYDSLDWDYIIRDITLSWLTTSCVKFQILSEVF